MTSRNGQSFALDPSPVISIAAHEPHENQFPAGIVDLRGQEMMYSFDFWSIGSGPCLLDRYTISDHGILSPDPTWPRPACSTINGGTLLESIVVDPNDPTLGSGAKPLLATNGPWVTDNSTVTIWSSKDEGITWAPSGVTIVKPLGSVGIGQCGIAAGAGGVALTPMWGICQTWWAQGDDGMDWTKPGDWRPYLWQQAGAQVPPGILVAPVKVP